MKHFLGFGTVIQNNACVKTLLHEDLSELVFYGDFIYKFIRTEGNTNFSAIPEISQIKQPGFCGFDILWKDIIHVMFIRKWCCWQYPIRNHLSFAVPVFSVKLNLQPKLGLDSAISIANWFFGSFTMQKTICFSPEILTLVLLNPDIPYLCKQCRSDSEEANRSGSALFAIKYVNLYLDLVIWVQLFKTNDVVS